MLETRKHGSSVFVTVTYGPENVPVLEDGKSTLNILDYQLWIKRLRRKVGTVRYFLVGEYDVSMRPHYHAILFGVKECVYGDSRNSPVRACRCGTCTVVRESWGLGFVHVGAVETKSAQYVAGYTVKRMVRKDDPRLGGRFPEFARMSLRPGIGAEAMYDVAKRIGNSGMEIVGDVPSALRAGARLLPLGRYLRRQLRRSVGLGEEAPEATLNEYKQKLSHLWVRAQRMASDVGASAKWAEKKFEELVVAEDAERVRQLEARLKIHERKKGSLQ